MMILLLMLLLVLPDAVRGATYYVATTGSDAANGASGTPWRNPQKCAQTPVAAGDTCIVRDGTYTDSNGDNYVVLAFGASSASGSINNPITIKSENPLGAVITIPSAGTANRGFYIDKPYYIIEGFSITGGGGSGTSLSNSGILFTEGATGGIARKNSFNNIGRTTCTNSSSAFTGISAQATNLTIERNLFYKIGRLRLNESGCGSSQTAHDHGIYAKSAHDIVIKYNIFDDVNRGYAIQFFTSGSTTNRPKVLSNLFINPTPGTAPSGCVMLANTINDLVMLNNLAVGCTTSLVTSFALTISGSTISYNIQSTNDTSGDNILTFTKPAGITTGNNTDNANTGSIATGGPYTLTAGHVAIDAGTASGLTCNGTCDVGAFETMTFSSCAVPSGATSTIRMTVTNNAHPPTLPATGLTTVTARRNGSNNAVNGSVDRVGDGIFDIPVTTSYGGGDTVDISGSTWNMTDSALIGGTLNQPFVVTLTNQSCSNAAPSHTLTQARFEWHYYRGLEASPIVLPYGYASTGAAENYAGMDLFPGGLIRLRFAIVCGAANCPPLAFSLFYSTGGAYAMVPDAFDAGNIKSCGEPSGNDMPTNGGGVTNQLSTGGTLAGGGTIFTSNAVPTVTGFDQGFKVENEYCIQLDTDASGFFDLRVYEQGGAALNTYTVTPRLTVEPISYGGVGQ